MHIDVQIVHWHHVCALWVATTMPKHMVMQSDSPGKRERERATFANDSVLVRCGPQTGGGHLRVLAKPTHIHVCVDATGHHSKLCLSTALHMNDQRGRHAHRCFKPT